jgi:hypothetical protein
LRRSNSLHRADIFRRVPIVALPHRSCYAVGIMSSYTTHHASMINSLTRYLYYPRCIEHSFNEAYILIPLYRIYLSHPQRIDECNLNFLVCVQILLLCRNLSLCFSRCSQQGMPCWCCLPTCQHLSFPTYNLMIPHVGNQVHIWYSPITNILPPPTWIKFQSTMWYTSTRSAPC